MDPRAQCPSVAYTYVAKSPISSAYKRREPISSTLIMHGGWQVRSLKVFARYHYVPPEI
jgi:hypothetical protein